MPSNAFEWHCRCFEALPTAMSVSSTRPIGRVHKLPTKVDPLAIGKSSGLDDLPGGANGLLAKLARALRSARRGGRSFGTDACRR